VPTDPFLQLYAAIRKMPAFQPGNIAFPATAVLGLNEYALYEHVHEVDALFAEAFFAFLAYHLWDRADRNVESVVSGSSRTAEA